MSAPDRQVIFTAEASADLASIMLYTANQWGFRQRDTYAELVASALRELSHFPDLGRFREHIASGLRTYPVQQHVIYYRDSGQPVTIVRIVHGKMDAPPGLSGNLT